MRAQPLSPSHQRLLGAALLWLLGGTALLMTTLVPLHSRMFGWSPVLMLLVAPLSILLILEPGLPRQLLALRRQRTSHQAIWH